ncbi:Arylsulfatase [Pigmentiphaga humi]|uniref:Arylsulfatase n=1 Tax=Pigmentiphaga humi TaxID=2478468 RepID=A0A3P4B6Z9_9BURK|nr:sulfatase-like hydrolase/transferase [Pigmentiphaga humi]VCU71458.1 Arylsulfatase [Pigmentiphaga humi]
MAPNIIFITSDQHRADAMGFLKPEVHTPHLDRLSADGTHFGTCITPSYVCQPARASILTGLLPLTHGVRDNGIDLPPDTGARGFAGQLGSRGYETAFFGKAHFSTKATFAATGTPEDQYNGALYERGWEGPYMGFQHVNLSVVGHFHKDRPPKRPLVGHWERWFLERGHDEEALRVWAEEVEAGQGAAQTWASALPVAWHSSTWIADRTIEWLSRRDRRKPFCIWTSFPDPHHPFDCPLPWSRLHRPAEISLPANRVMDLDRRPWWHRASLEGKPELDDPVLRRFREKGSRMPVQSDGQLAEMTANYYGMISLVDHSVGRILEALSHLQLADETYVVYASDHGDMLGNHGLYLKGPTPYEDLLRVPLLVRGPGVEAGATVNEPVSTLDLAPTFMEWSGAQPGANLHGSSLAGLCRGEDAPREAAYCEWHVEPSRCGVALRLHTVRTRTAKLTVEANSGAGEMYDLAADPDEMDNLFDKPEALALRQELEGLLAKAPSRSAEAAPLPIVGMT